MGKIKYFRFVNVKYPVGPRFIFFYVLIHKKFLNVCLWHSLLFYYFFDFLKPLSNQQICYLPTPLVNSPGQKWKGVNTLGRAKQQEEELWSVNQLQVQRSASTSVRPDRAVPHCRTERRNKIRQSQSRSWKAGWKRKSKSWFFLSQPALGNQGQTKRTLLLQLIHVSYNRFTLIPMQFI